MTKFEVGKKYCCSSIYNSNSMFEFEVIKRTDKTVTIKNSDGEIKRRKIDTYNNQEIIYPNGKYSMCLVLGSNDLVKEEKTQYVAEEETTSTKDNVISVDFQKAEEKTEKPKQKYYEINENMAERAKSMRSFDDYKQGSATQEYRQLVDEARMIAENQKSRTDSIYHEKIDYYLDLYARKLAENINKYYEIGTRCPSIMIVGAGNFPVKKKEKQVEAWNKNAQEYQEIQKILDKIEGIGQGGISSDDPKAIEKLKEKLLSLEQKQECMKQVNAYYKKHNTLTGCTALAEKEKFWVYNMAQNITKRPADVIASRNFCCYLINCVDYTNDSLLSSIDETKYFHMNLWQKCKNNFVWLALKVNDSTYMTPYEQISYIAHEQENTKQFDITKYAVPLNGWLLVIGIDRRHYIRNRKEKKKC